MENIGDLTPFLTVLWNVYARNTLKNISMKKKKYLKEQLLFFWYYYTVFNQSIYVESFILSLLSISFQNVAFNVNPFYASVLFLHSQWTPWRTQFPAFSGDIEREKAISSLNFCIRAVKNRAGTCLTLTLSWRRPLSYRNQSTDLLCESMDWFLYDNGPRHERVKWLSNVISFFFFAGHNLTHVHCYYHSHR